MSTNDREHSKIIKRARRWFIYSLQGRLLLASIFCLPLFIGASGWLLDRAFQNNLRSAEAEQLKTQLYILLGAAEWKDNKLTLPDRLADPRFSSITSGLYGQVTLNSALVWRSSSAQLLTTPLPSIEQSHTVNQESFDETENLFRFCYDLSWEDDNRVEQPLRFQLFHTRDQFLARLKSYRQQLWGGLVPLALGLLFIQLMILRWGLRPLSKLAKDINSLPHTQGQQLMGDYPAEIMPVTESLNQVLKSEQLQQQRYKNTLGDLAHSLKTPLSIIQGEDTEKSSVVTEQLNRMNNIIRHQLQRAVIQSHHPLRQQQLIRPVVQRLCGAMQKVYRDKKIEIDIDIAKDLSYPIDSQDLFEILGNVIENACKYGKKKILIGAGIQGDTLKVTVGDDGDGIAENASDILQRGTRMDTAKPGQGLGLAIATDIISAYDGSLDISQCATLGGASFTITLPHKN